MTILRLTAAALCSLAFASVAGSQQPAGAPPADTTINDAVKTMVSRLELERYKATIKGLTQFGDRRQGTDRNRAAVDWIEAQLKSYGCANTERITYNYTSPPPRAGGRGGQRAASANATGGGRIRR